MNTLFSKTRGPLGHIGAHFVGISCGIVMLCVGLGCFSKDADAQPRVRVAVGGPGGSIVYDSNPQPVIVSTPVQTVQTVTEIIGTDGYGNAVYQDFTYDGYGNVFSASDPYIDVNAVQVTRRVNRVVYRRRIARPLPRFRRRMFRQSIRPVVYQQRRNWRYSRSSLNNGRRSRGIRNRGVRRSGIQHRQQRINRSRRNTNWRNNNRSRNINQRINSRSRSRNSNNRRCSRRNGFGRCA